MKKILTFVLAMAVMLSAAVAVNAEEEFKPSTYNTAKGTATVDGVMDEAYLQSDEILVEKGGLDRDLLEGHATAKVRTLWDDENFYIYAEVNDTTPGGVPTEEDPAWENESVEIYIDYENNKDDTNSIGTNEYSGQIRICRYPDSYAKITGVGAASFVENLTYKVVDNGKDGYIVEAAIKHNGLIAGEMGFAFQVNDDMDGDKVRDSVVYVHAEQKDAWKVTYLLDTVNIVGYVAPETPDETSSEEPSSDEYVATDSSAEESLVADSSEEIEQSAEESQPDASSQVPVDSGKISPVVIIAIIAVAVVIIAVVVVVVVKKKK